MGRFNLQCPNTAVLFGMYNLHPIPTQICWGWESGLKGEERRVDKNKQSKKF